MTENEDGQQSEDSTPKPWKGSMWVAALQIIATIIAMLVISGLVLAGIVFLAFYIVCLAPGRH